jgi:SNF2 family DNA or RNA helicase
MCLVNPSVVGEFWQFRNRYCVIEYKEVTMLDKAKRKQGIFERVTRKFSNVVGYQNLPELRDKIDPYYIRREKKDVLKDLPDKAYETLEVDLTKEQRELYNVVRDDFANAFRGVDVSPANALVYFVRAKQICDSAELYNAEMNESAKLDELKNLIEDLMPRIKKKDSEEYEYLPGAHSVVLFSQYRQMTDIMVREFKSYTPLYLHGAVKSQDRQVLIDAFQNHSDKYKLFISTLRAGGVGITLTAADVVILYDKWFSPSANNQATDRVHRIGQKNAVTVIDFICKDTIEERVEEILTRKKHLFEGIFGEEEAVLTKLTSEELKELL